MEDAHAAVLDLQNDDGKDTKPASVDSRLSFFGVYDDFKSSGFPEQIFFGSNRAFFHLGDMLEIPLDHFPGKIHCVFEPLDHTVPQKLVVRIDFALLDS